MPETPVENATPRAVEHTSKHRKGHQPKMTDAAKRRRDRAAKASIQDYLNRKALENAE